MSDTARFSIRLAIEGQPETFDVDLETHGTSLAGLVPLAYEVTQRLVEREEARRRNRGNLVTCRPKCTQCCHQLVVLTVPEVLYLEEAISRTEGLAEGFAARERELEARNWVEELFEPTLSETPPFLPIAVDYFNAQLPCPALRDDLCSIYADRPLPCRTHSVTSDPARCAKPFDGGVEKVELPQALSPALALAAAALLDEDPVMIPLPLVPRWLRASGADVRRRFAPEALVNAFMHALGGAGRGGSA